ncbi:hypothetical protein SCP_0803020 [Sparassis crispa]|uniref:Uncharacterized protein n=1 Tax=Sparassis crispa TaxID=139825 RepID=A0A401GUB7_9APHY|nr:hypothetical protein SCP_0803020 [Sparassis crispa]GBE85780.1 hypothetical protein SCP_0803020 [Sparassis crispa]
MIFAKALAEKAVILAKKHLLPVSQHILSSSRPSSTGTGVRITYFGRRLDVDVRGRSPAHMVSTCTRPFLPVRAP